MLSFAASMRYGLQDKGVSVTTLPPGLTDSNVFPRAGMDDTEVGSSGNGQNHPTDVARQGFDALMAGREQVVAASLKTKLQQAVGAILPGSARAAQHRSMSEPGPAKG